MIVLWVIYDHPSDFPKHFVVRRHNVIKGVQWPELEKTLHDSLEEARSVLPAGLFNLGRQPGDDPVIKEVWI